jgi:tetratricopeptide (TPR) repeat protein
MVRYAKLNPAGYFTLGRYFADRQVAGKAAEYYEKGVELATDPVLVANNCDWLVRHYFENGRREKAEALADRAAEVYSSGGLRTKGELMEMEKKYDEALEYVRRNEERYDQPGPLVGFCVRYKAETGDSRYDKLVQERFKTLFPRGIERSRLRTSSRPQRKAFLFH